MPPLWVIIVIIIMGVPLGFAIGRLVGAQLMRLIIWVVCREDS